MSALHHQRLIARGLAAEVEHCADCGVLHLGALSLRLKPAALNDLRDTLSRALENLPQGADTATDGVAARNCH